MTITCESCQSDHQDEDAECPWCGWNRERKTFIRVGKIGPIPLEKLNLQGLVTGRMKSARPNAMPQPEDWNLQNMHTASSKFLVLGLLGPAGSGKDLVADWLCKEKGFVKVAFADPIKRFAMKCFGFDFDRLWGPSELRNESITIDEAWWMEAIGHMGDAAVEIVNDVLTEGTRVDGYLKLHDWLTKLRKDYRESISARVVLQTLGTEWGRSVDELMWAKYAHRIAHLLQVGEGATYSQKHGFVYDEDADNPEYKGVVIPDHRFANEVKITQEAGGFVLRLRRTELEKKDEVVGIAGHRSESELKTLSDDLFDIVLHFPEGIEKVYQTLENTWKESQETSWNHRSHS